MPRYEFVPFPEGFRAGRLTVTRTRERGEKHVECVCDCGRVVRPQAAQLLRNPSCGCRKFDSRRVTNDVLRSDGAAVWFRVNHTEVVIDIADIARVAKYHWRLFPSITDGRYAVAKGPLRGSPTIYMHRLLLETPAGLETDHVDGNGLNNRRSNLRVATDSQNGANKRKPTARAGQVHTSSFKGVWRPKRSRQWQAHLQVGGERRYLGAFPSEELAAQAYDDAALETWGEFAQLNFPREVIA